MFACICYIEDIIILVWYNTHNSHGFMTLMSPSCVIGLTTVAYINTNQEPTVNLSTYILLNKPNTSIWNKEK